MPDKCRNLKDAIVLANEICERDINGPEPTREEMAVLELSDAYQDQKAVIDEIAERWGNGVVNGFCEFHDDIKDCLTDEQQKQGIAKAEED